MRTVAVHVKGNDRVDGHAEQRAVDRRDRKHAPRPEGRQHFPNPCGVALENVSDGFQREVTSLRVRATSFELRATSHCNDVIARSSMLVTHSSVRPIVSKIWLSAKPSSYPCFVFPLNS